MPQRVWRPFREAREFARSLGLMGQSEWYAYARGDLASLFGRRPDDIPWNPMRTYRGRGWKGIRDWLGPPPIEPVEPGYLTFTRARALARSLGFLTAAEWRAWGNGESPGSRERPANVPIDPQAVYPRAWRGWRDWLGVSPRSVRPLSSSKFLPFAEARKIVRALEFTHNRDWRAWCRAGKRPEDIPANPQSVYQHRGWVGWGDWFGTGKSAATRAPYLSYAEACAFVRSVGIQGEDDFRDWVTGKLPDLAPRPSALPTNPHRTYRDDGWTTWGEFLGTGNVAPWKRTYVTYEEAMRLSRPHGIQSATQWRPFARRHNASRDPDSPRLPVFPEVYYTDHPPDAGEGWTSWGEFLGTGVVATARRTYRSFESAREFVRELGLRSNPQWRLYVKGALDGLPPLPDDIPRAPAHQYRSTGWKSWPDFLGTAPGKARRTMRPRRGAPSRHNEGQS